MTPRRFILILLAAVGLPTLFTFFSLLHTHPRGRAATESASLPPKNGFQALFSFNTPSTLFPPSAIISLTDDNSTFFLARPADFGPSLSSDGLSGQLWIGSGFGGEGLGRAGNGAEGELGCSDVPGWEDRNSQKASMAPTANVISGVTNIQSNAAANENEVPSEDDGTDDHLQHPSPSSSVSKPVALGQSSQHIPPEDLHSSTHADIQSLQESAEISSKIVLLSRGGCGFLEKAKWAQRRGAKALIVGDQTRGGALITMYARGDTSNISIPSLFTSHTTAHLLSSLIPPEDDDEEEGSKKGAAGTKEALKDQMNDDGPTFTPSAPKPTSLHSQRLHSRHVKSTDRNGYPEGSRSLLKRLAMSMGLSHHDDISGLIEDTRRPPSSGRLDWFSERWSDEPAPEMNKARAKNQDKKKSKTKTFSSDTVKEAPKSGSHPGSADGFLIGVQDWRDPDLVVANKVNAKVKTTKETPSTSGVRGKKEEAKEIRPAEGFKGGSITPGSGQYLKPGNNPDSAATATKEYTKGGSAEQSKNTKAEDSGRVVSSGDMDEEHEGLWVTLTPTTMSSNPFFDTLLVLVVSPLVTLTVVYALLLLRSRIRRRRWRAPKSVVERLPIRTYHTMSCSSTTSSTRLATPQATSPATPLLRSNSQSIARSRPRSATASAIGDAVSASLDKATSRVSANSTNEKPILSGKKKKYTGKQVECVVCLEEYIDGQSRIMSLPCGHEFHAECITPWLTTRRRTCPICKGDVVRSLQHPKVSSPHSHSPTNESRPSSPTSNTDIQAQAATTTNESPSAAIPIPSDHSTSDLERGDDEDEDLAATLVNDNLEEAESSRRTWRGLAASLSLSAFSGEAVWRRERTRADRNR